MVVSFSYLTMVREDSIAEMKNQNRRIPFSAISMSALLMSKVGLSFVKLELSPIYSWCYFHFKMRSESDGNNHHLATL